MRHLHRPIIGVTCAAFLAVFAQLGIVPERAAWAAESVTPVAAPTLQPTPISTATATAIPISSPTATPTIPVRLETVPTRVAHKKTRPKVGTPRRIVSRATPTPTPVVEQTNASRGNTRRNKKHHARAKRSKKSVHATPTARPTPTPSVVTSADDSIKPITCNGSGKPLANRPFLAPPYHGWTEIVSYFDHDSPNFLKDGQIIVSTGLVINLGDRGEASDFPAYWSSAARQYVYYDGHNGYDYNLWYQPVFAAAAGKVIFAAYEYPQLPHSGYGQMVMINHGNGYVTLYGHFSRLEVKKGQKVRAGQEIGISGNSGHSSGPHLHFTVFHNCSPTDPYGWSGSPPDPLTSYEGETSVYLWKRPPLVSNPLAGLAGNDRLPAGVMPRLLLLRLPSSNVGSRVFTAHLSSEESRVVSLLANRGIQARADILRGAVLVTGRASIAALYALPNVLSVATLDEAADARQDVLLALAQAALMTPHHAWRLGPSHAWTGYLLQWQGQTLLVGKGPRAREVRIRFSKGSGGAFTKSVRTDAGNGSYVVDLGRLSPEQRARISNGLAGTRPIARPAIVQAAAVTHRASTTRTARGQSRWPWLGAAAFLLLLGGYAAYMRRQSRIARG